jgi:hypothetical protein
MVDQSGLAPIIVKMGQMAHLKKDGYYRAIFSFSVLFPLTASGQTLVHLPFYKDSRPTINSIFDFIGIYMYPHPQHAGYIGRKIFYAI